MGDGSLAGSCDHHCGGRVRLRRAVVELAGFRSRARGVGSELGREGRNRRDWPVRPILKEAAIPGSAILELRTLGAIELQDARGQTIEKVLHQPKRLALLVYLAVAAPRGLHRRDSIVALFWPELSEKRARNALSKAIHFL